MLTLFGFSTSSSAATLPLNLKIAEKDFGIDEDIASFVLPLGMTINMDGTAIMQVIAAIFIAGYNVTLGSTILIGLSVIVSSIGTPAVAKSENAVNLEAYNSREISKEAPQVNENNVIAK